MEQGSSPDISPARQPKRKSLQLQALDLQSLQSDSSNQDKLKVLQSENLAPIEEGYLQKKKQDHK